MSISEMVNPRGLAIVGASETRYYARSLIENLRSAGFDESRIFPVHPKNDQVLGIRCYPSLSAIPTPVDVVIIATNQATVEGILVEAGSLGIGSAVVLADGYAEQGEEGKERQRQLQKVAEDAGVRVLGPNTLGFIAPPTATAAWSPGILRTPIRKGSMGVVFQSSGMLNLFLNLCIDREIGLSAAFSLGNEASYDTADFVSFLAKDENTRVISLLIETTTNPRRLAAALEEARRAGKPVVALKLGASERARANAIAHTGRMASPGTSWEALLQRLGVILVKDLDELVETAVLFSGIDLDALPKRATQVGFVTVSGGDCSLLCDLAEELGVPLPDVSPDTLVELRKLLDKPDLLGNPLDMENLLREDAGRFYASIEALCADPQIDVAVFRMYLPTKPTDEIKQLYRELVARARAAGKAAVVVTRAIEEMDAAWYRFFGEELGVPFLPSYRPALRSLSYLAAWRGTAPATGQLALDAIPEATTVVEQGRVASWESTQQVLRDAGVPYAPARFAHDEQSAVRAADELGYPVAVKLVSGDVAHKSDIGGVILGVATPDDVEASVKRIREAAGAAGATIDGYEIQAMAAGKGVEMIVGMTRDASAGPLLMVGMGGILAELLKDVVLVVPEVEPEDVRALLGSLTGEALLHGFRGAPPADVDALCTMIADLSRYVARAGDQLIALDVNPVIVLPEGQGVVAVDALAVVRER